MQSPAKYDSLYNVPLEVINLCSKLPRGVGMITSSDSWKGYQFNGVGGSLSLRSHSHKKAFCSLHFKKTDVSSHFSISNNDFYIIGKETNNNGGFTI